MQRFNPLGHSYLLSYELQMFVKENLSTGSTCVKLQSRVTSSGTIVVSLTFFSVGGGGGVDGVDGMAEF